jgi:hypothetical protein
MAKVLAGEKIKTYQHAFIPHVHGKVKQKRSLFWVHWNINVILDGMYKWYKKQNEAIEVVDLDKQ